MAWTANIQGGVVQLRSAQTGGTTVSVPPTEAFELEAAIAAMRPELVALVREEVTRQVRDTLADFVRRTDVFVAGPQVEEDGYWVVPVRPENLAQIAAYKTPGSSTTDDQGLTSVTYGRLRLVRGAEYTTPTP